jgi:hypothetical protein
LPAGEAKERFREAVPPADTTLDDKTSVSVWAKANVERHTRMTAIAYLAEKRIIQIDRRDHGSRVAVQKVRFRPFICNLVNFYSFVEHGFFDLLLAGNRRLTGNVLPVA